MSEREAVLFANDAFYLCLRARMSTVWMLCGLLMRR